MTVLKAIGILLAVVDFFGLSERCEKSCIALRDRLTDAMDRLEEKIGGRWFLLNVAIGVVWLVLMVVGMSLLHGDAAGVYAVVVTGLVALVFFGQLLLSLVVLSLHVMSLPPRGIIGSVGLLLAIFG